MAAIALAGCQTADNKVPQIAADFCACFTKMERDMSEQTKGIMHNAALSADPEATLKADVNKLSDEEKTKVGTEMISLGQMEDKSSEIGKCMDDVAKKYDKARTFNEKKFMQKLVKELDAKPGCRFTADLMQIGLKAKD